MTVRIANRVATDRRLTIVQRVLSRTPSVAAAVARAARRRRRPPYAPLSCSTRPLYISSVTECILYSKFILSQRARASTGSTSPGSKKPKSGKKGTFSQEEDALIIELVKKHGAKWSLIKPFVGNGRWTGAQIGTCLSPLGRFLHASDI